jgi:hypothetical protein
MRFYLNSSVSVVTADYNKGVSGTVLQAEMVAGSMPKEGIGFFLIYLSILDAYFSCNRLSP